MTAQLPGSIRRPLARHSLAGVFAVIGLALAATACSSSTGNASAGSTSTDGVAEQATTTQTGGKVTPALEDPKIWVVYSSVDDDAQLLVNAGATEPMSKLKITDPAGRVVEDLKFDGTTVGQADVTLEGPEPKMKVLESAFPSGEYRFDATTTEGNSLTATATLSYKLLPPPRLVAPLAGARDVNSNNLVIKWKPVAGATRIHFELEPEKAPPSGAIANPKFTIDLPANATEIAIPTGWLQSGVEYVYDVKALAQNDSVTVTDATFTTR